MKSILLIGLGRFGRHLAIDLNKQNCEILAIDSKENRIEDVLPYVSNALIGDCTSKKFLESLGVSNFDVCFVAIGSDFQSSLITTSFLKELGAKKVIARAAKDIQAKFLTQIGADEIIYPEKQIASWAAIRYSSEHILDYIEVSEDYGIYEVELPNSWIGKTVGEIDIRKTYNVNIMAVKKEGNLQMEITPSTKFNETDRILILGKNKDVRRCFKL